MDRRERLERILTEAIERGEISEQEAREEMRAYEQDQNED